MIIEAAQLAHAAHAGVRRKYTNRPYIEHPMRVAGRASLIRDVKPAVVAAAWLHDVIEDCDSRFGEKIARWFDSEVIELVRELTNPSKQWPTLPREERKRMDREHAAKTSYWARVIKFIDRIDNLEELPEAAGSFRPKYAGESVLLADVLLGGTTDETLLILYNRLLFMAKDMQASR